jgi:tRNA (cytidine/uridine-2'-O-)-methyltransferase
MIQVALWEPEIPPNTGNIARLCAATASPLHLIGRLGFRIDEKSVRRAGLDYWDHVTIHRHDTLEEFLQTISISRLWCVDNPAPVKHTEVQYQAGDCLLFGSETRGLPQEVKQRFADQLVSIPMLTEHVRSLNLANSVSIVVYEALRQLHKW